jgi:hypothetical protein
LKLPCADDDSSEHENNNHRADKRREVRIDALGAGLCENRDYRSEDSG